MSTRHMNGGGGVSNRPSSATTKTGGTSDKKSDGSKRKDREHSDTPMSEALTMECKAAFIAAVKGSSTNSLLSSKAELLLALQNTGRNPTQRNLSKYWTKSTEDLSFDDFCQICKKEPVTTEDDLMKAFKKIDMNGDGFLSHSELKKVMTTKGEKMTDEEVTRLIDEVDENKDGKLDYKEFCNMVLSTSEKCKETAARRYERKNKSAKTERSSSRERTSSQRDVTDDKPSDSRSEVKVSSRNKENNSSGSRGENNSSSSVTGKGEHNSSSSSIDKTESKRTVPRSPRLSPRSSPRVSKGAKNKEDYSKEKFGSQASLRSVDSNRDTAGDKISVVSPTKKSSKPPIQPAVNKNNTNNNTDDNSNNNNNISEDDDDDIVVSAAPKQTRVVTEERSPQPRPRISSLDKKSSNNNSLADGSPKPAPAPRRLSRQEASHPPISTLNLQLQPPKKLSSWTAVKRRGMFYLDDNNEISSTQYTMNITKSTSVWITISPSPSQSTAQPPQPVDMCLLLLRNKPDKSGNSLEAFTEKRDVTGKFGVRCDLEKGVYTLIAFTSGCGLPLCKASSGAQKKLVKQKPGSTDQYTLTKEFKYVLTDIFNMVDVDMNGLLSREEFTSYSMRTGGEEVGDEEWDVVKEHTDLKQGELTCKGFIYLIELEAQDADGDTDDLWVSLEAMGYDSSLMQNQAYPFCIEVYTESAPTFTLDAKDSLISNKSRAMQNALKEAYIDKAETLSSENRCAAAKSSGNDKDVKIYVYESDTIASVIIENKAKSKAVIKLDCTASKNMKPNGKLMSKSFTVPANSATVAFHLVPEDETKEWLVSCMERSLQLN